MLERRASRPKEVMQKIKEKSARDKIFLAVEAASLVLLGLYIASTIGLAATGRFEETKDSAMDTLRMAATTTIVYGIDKFTKFSLPEK